MKRVRILAPKEGNILTHSFEVGQECTLIEDRKPQNWVEKLLAGDGNQCIEGEIEGVTVVQYLSLEEGEYEIID